MTGKWEVGERIPTEKELTQKFNVSRFTVRQSHMELTREGYWPRQAGKGTFVKSWKDIQKHKQTGNSKKQICLVLPYEDHSLIWNTIKRVESEAKLWIIEKFS